MKFPRIKKPNLPTRPLVLVVKVPDVAKMAKAVRIPKVRVSIER